MYHRPAHGGEADRRLVLRGPPLSLFIIRSRGGGKEGLVELVHRFVLRNAIITVKEEEISKYSNLCDPQNRRRSIDEVHIEGITGKHVNVAVIDSYDIRFQNGIQENHDASIVHGILRM